MTAAASGDESDMRPVVARPSGGLSLGAFAALAVAGGAILFAVLESRRQDAGPPSVTPRAVDMVPTTSAAPSLFVPPPIEVPPPAVAVAPVAVVSPTPPPPPPPAPAPRTVYVPSPPPVIPSVVAEPPRRSAGGQVLVIDNGTRAAPTTTTAQPMTGGATTAAGPGSTDRVRAGAFANPSTTIIQGTLIAAVLETALDSSRPGFARAIVQQDVRSFDGARVLIPRGSRVIGEYRADATRGQNRALVTWTRLIRPDGATIEIGSPAADQMGGIGIKARVNTHFFERFGAGLLQTVLGVGGTIAATRLSRGSVIVAPGLIQNNNVAQPLQRDQIQPTLKVRQGTSISIFVARDLDFTTVENQR